ncbi:MAG: hypothetical protein KI793_09820 [Rivularia sp. (in: Bacteria)]|nr:hypothetical protein [Rivularia sp. MS3]
MKLSWLRLLHKIALITAVSVLVFSTTSCANTQTNYLPEESVSTSTQTPNPSLNQLPPKVESAVLSDAVKRTSRPLAALRITQAQKQNWSDSCLGLAEPGKFCAQVIVPGWKVIVTDGQRKWAYRTNESGQQVKLEYLQR